MQKVTGQIIIHDTAGAWSQRLGSGAHIRMRQGKVAWDLSADICTEDDARAFARGIRGIGGPDAEDGLTQGLVKRIQQGGKWSLLDVIQECTSEHLKALLSPCRPVAEGWDDASASFSFTRHEQNKLVLLDFAECDDPSGILALGMMHLAASKADRSSPVWLIMDEISDERQLGCLDPMLQKKPVTAVISTENAPAGFQERFGHSACIARATDTELHLRWLSASRSSKHPASLSVDCLT